MNHLQYLPTKASVIKALLVQFSMEDAPAFESVKKYYEKLPGNFKNDLFIEQLSKSEPPVRGRKFDTEKLFLQTGVRPGKAPYHLFIFYSSDCPHCQRQIPRLYKYLQNEKNIDVVAIGIEEDKQHWQDFSKTFTKWKNACVIGNKSMETVMDFKIEYTPTFYLTDKHFVILEKTDGGSEIYKILKYFLKHESKEEGKNRE
jgi:thiol-disulfide isomerase/thioredoxin